MRIEFLTQDDPLYILSFFKEFFRHYGSEFGVTRVSCCPTMGKRSRAKLLKELWWLYGTTGLLHLLTRVALARLMGLFPQGRAVDRFCTLAQLCRAHSIAYAHIGNPNVPEFVEGVRKREPDLIVSVACPFILKGPLLSLPPKGCINIHHALLPEYKGMMPTFWQMYHGEEKVGVTIHYMTEKVDEGDALCQAELEIERGESLDHLIRRSKRHAAHCLGRVLQQIQSGSTVPVKLDPAKGSYFSFPGRDRIFEFRRRGFRAL